MANLTSIQSFIITLAVLLAFLALSLLFIVLIIKNKKAMNKDKYLLISDYAKLNEILRLMDYRIKNSKCPIFFTLILISIDDYGSIKDIINSEGAKEYLTRLKEALRSVLPIGAKMAQTEEKETFLVYLPDYYDEEARQEIAQRFKSSAEKTLYVRNSIPIQKSASVAVTAYPEQGDNVIKLINNLLVAVYSAKKAGGNEMIYYSTELEKDRRYTERYKEIKQAIDRERIIIRYNPLINMDKECISGAVASICMVQENGNIIPFDNVTEHLEEYNDEFWFTVWSIEKSMLSNKDIIRSEKGKDFFFTFKAGINFLTNPSVALKLQDSLEKYNISANKVVLEVEDIQENPLGNRLVKNLMQVQGVGVKIAANINHADDDLSKIIEVFDVDFLQINVDIILDGNQHIQELLKLAYNYRKKVIVTDIINAEQAQRLKSKTIAYVEGHFYGQNLTNQQLVDLMHI